MSDLSVFGLELPIEIITLGLITGITYGLLGMGLTLVYRTSRVINFAHGEIGALPAILLSVLVVNQGWSYWLVLPLALLLAASLGGLTERTVIRRLSGAPRLNVLVATIGVSQILLVCNILIPREGELASRGFPVPISWSHTIGTYVVSPGQILILTVAPVVVIALTWFLARTRLGMASRASAENQDAALLAGVPVHRVSMTIWSMAGLLAGVSAILVGPTQPVLTQMALGPSLMVRALAAALIGRLVSLPWAFAGGIAMGVLEATVSFNYPTGGTLELVIFLAIIGILLFRRGLSQQTRGGEESSWSMAGLARPLRPAIRNLATVKRARRLGFTVLVAVAVLAPLPMSNAQRVLLAGIVVFAIMGLSLVVLTGYAGQVSLGQFAFVGIGAFVGGRMLQLGYPPWMAMLYTVLAGGLTAGLIGLPALRIRGLFLAVATLAFSLAASNWLFAQEWLAAPGANSIPRPILFGVDMQNTRNYYWFCLAVFVVVAMMVHRIRWTGLGRAMIAVRDNEAAAATLSVSPRRAKLAAFVLSGAIAALGGYLYGGLLVVFNAGVFGTARSLNLLALVIFGGVTTVTGAVLGAIWVQGIPYFFGSNIGLASSGIGLLLVLLLLPGGLASLVFRARDAVVARLIGNDPADGPPPEQVIRPSLPARLAAEASTDEAPPRPLEARGILVTYGAIRAVDGVSLELNRGEILGLVGPNGAGKTTLFDVLSGQIQPAEGAVLLHGDEVTGLRPERRALLGLGRTFQQARLFDSLTIRETLALALERAEPSEAVPSVLGLPPSRRAERAKISEADDLIELLGLEPFADRQIAELSTGTRRLAELGCAVALGADVLLLDEPMAGIAQREVEAFVPVLREIRDHLDASMVVIDHDLPMIGSVSDRLMVLASGSVVASGPPSILRDDPRVVAAYLGTDERAIDRSGAARRGSAAAASTGRGERPVRVRAASDKGGVD
jgi:ABC-type branched-subunit amino acid transport system ATPase component/ABC-type branched-subunit amino acid transport system permease subunit